MATRRIQLRFTLLMLGMLVLVGCQKKCQPDETTKFKTITGTDWRLVDTSDKSPVFQNLSNTSFVIFNFSTTYTGSVKKVENNLALDQAPYSFIYTIDPDAKAMRVQYTAATGQTQQAGTTQANSGPIVQYSYDLTNKLVLYDETDPGGPEYHFVPFKGTVAPDDQCTF